MRVDDMSEYEIENLLSQQHCPCYIVFKDIYQRKNDKKLDEQQRKYIEWLISGYLKNSFDGEVPHDLFTTFVKYFGEFGYYNMNKDAIIAYPCIDLNALNSAKPNKPQNELNATKPVIDLQPNQPTSSFIPQAVDNVAPKLASKQHKNGECLIM